MGFQITADQLPELARAWWLGFSAYGLAPYPDAASTLRKLKERGFATAIINNGTHGVDFWRSDLADFGLLPHLDIVLSSGDHMWCKPHPFLFTRALEFLDVRPAEAIMVGDMPEAAIVGAKALGITTVWKRNGQPLPALPDADHTIDELSELLSLPILQTVGPP